MRIESVVVTGASNGIGAACVEAFQLRGVRVIGVDKEAISGAQTHLQLDLESPGCGAEMATFLGSDHVDGLVNNAAAQLNARAEETTATQIDRIFAINLRAPLLLAGALKEKLAARQGFVVNVASVHALASSPNISAYAASKGGLTALTRALAVEWGPEIRVNAVLPGAIDTEMLVDGVRRSDLTIEELARRHPLGRVGTPEEVAAAVVYLATESFSSGASLVLDGGATARLSTE